MIWTILQLLIIIAMPWAGKMLHKKPFFSQWMSPVVFCYGIGIIIRQLNLFPLDEHLSNYITQGTIILAIPLLLFSTKILKWLKYTGKGLLSFGLCVMSALLGSTLAWYTLGDTVSDPGRLSGMLVGIYTGGTPNMQAIGMALSASQEDIILINAADMLMGGAYLVFLSTIAHRVLKGILPDFEADAEENPEPCFSTNKYFNLKHSLIGVGLSLIIAAMAITIPFLIFGNMDHIALIILGLTTFSILAAFIPAVQNLESTFETGDYLLLMFCVALGLLADFSAIFEKGVDLMLYAGVAMFSSILLHFLFAKIFKIDRDTFIITSTAGIFGPVFIGQIAAVLGNRKLVFTGITLGLLGYAIGNFLGIGLAELLRMM